MVVIKNHLHISPSTFPQISSYIKCRLYSNYKVGVLELMDEIIARPRYVKDIKGHSYFYKIDDNYLTPGA